MQSAVTPYDYGGIWNPSYYVVVGSGSVNNSQVGARIEMSFSSFSPSYTGGTSTVLFRLILHPNWMTKSLPARPLFDVYCYVGNSVMSLTTASTSFYVDLYTSNFPFDSGTILKYPLDSYQVQVNIYCTYNVYDYYYGYLNFYLAVGNTDVGLFTPSAKFSDPYGTAATYAPFTL